MSQDPQDPSPLKIRVPRALTPEDLAAVLGRVQHEVLDLQERVSSREKAEEAVGGDIVAVVRGLAKRLTDLESDMQRVPTREVVAKVVALEVAQQSKLGTGDPPLTVAALRAHNRQLIPLRLALLLTPIMCALALGWFLQSKLYLTMLVSRIEAGEVFPATE